MQNMKVIVTRSEPGGSALVARLRGMGCDAVGIPLLEARGTGNPAPDTSRVQGIIVTSAHALEHGAALKHLPIYTVGAATARRAREAGWQTVIEGPGDVRKLASVLPKNQVLLHLAGEDLAPGTEEALGTLNVMTWTVYRTVPTGAHERDFTQILASDERAVITLHSSRAAALLRPYVHAYRNRMQDEGIIFLCLSTSVLESLDNSIDARGLYVADQPTEEAMEAALARLIF